MIDHYNVYVNGQYHAWTRQTRMRVSGRSGQPQTLTVVAVSSSGLRSAPSAGVKVTPL